MGLGEYFECEFEPCGSDRGGIIVHYRDSSILAVLNGPFVPASQPPSVFRGTLRLFIYGQDQEKREVSVIQNELEVLFSSCVLLEEYPRCIIEARIYVMKPGSCLIAACINAISVLLEVSGIHTRGFLIGTTEDSETSAYLQHGDRRHLWFNLVSPTDTPDSYRSALPDMEIEQQQKPNVEIDQSPGKNEPNTSNINGLLERIQFAIKQAYIQGHRTQIKGARE